MANFRTQAGPDGVPTLGRKITALHLFPGIVNSCQSSPSENGLMIHVTEPVRDDAMP